MSDDLNIKIPDQHYVGMQKRNSDELPLGFMTPDGTDAAAVKRKGTVDSWANGRWGKEATLPAQTFTNGLMSGFSMVRSIKRYGWNGGNVVWRIADPRGFELEINSNNLAQILRYCTIDHGEILDKCIWGRLGADNILIPEGSEVYQNAVRNTARVARKVSAKEVKRGMKIQLQNGTIGIYLGSYYVIDRGRYGKGENINDVFTISKAKKHAILVNKDTSQDMKHYLENPESIYIMSELKVSDVLDEIPGNEANHNLCEAYINRFYRDRNHINTNSGDFAGVSISKINPLTDIRWIEEPFDVSQISADYKDDRLNFLGRWIDPHDPKKQKQCLGQTSSYSLLSAYSDFTRKKERIMNPQPGFNPAYYPNWYDVEVHFYFLNEKAYDDRATNPKFIEKKIDNDRYGGYRRCNIKLNTESKTFAEMVSFITFTSLWYELTQADGSTIRLKY